MSIIKKLGITPGPWRTTGSDNHLISTKGDGVETIIGEFWNRCKKQNHLVCLAAPEMLEALIWIRKEFQYHMPVENIEIIIEKATGKSWQEIEELLNE